jgi:hypothetical protein
MIEITIFDDAGNIVVHEFEEAPTASQDQIDLAVSLIENGMDAHTAMRIAKSELL